MKPEELEVYILHLRIMQVANKLRFKLLLNNLLNEKSESYEYLVEAGLRADEEPEEKVKANIETYEKEVKESAFNFVYHDIAVGDLELTTDIVTKVLLDQKKRTKVEMLES